MKAAIGLFKNELSRLRIEMPPDPDDRNLKLHELVDRQGRLSAKGKRAERVLGDLQKASMTNDGGVSSQKEIPMITLKHRWMKNRNVVVGSTIFSFNDKGIAKVSNIGNSSLDAAALVKQANGLVVLVKEKEEEIVSETSEAEESVPLGAKVENSITEAAREAQPLKRPPRKGPPRKGPPRKKPPGRRK